MPAKPIYFIGGDKGGVGKSLVAMALLDYLMEREKTALLVDTDTSNPDVWRCYHDVDGILSESISLDQAEGWITLVNLCDRHPARPVIVNTAARNTRGLSTYGGTLTNTLVELQRQLITLWVINRQRDSLELLKQFIAAMPAAVVHVVRNLHWGDEAKFELYNTSTRRAAVEERGGLSLNFPDLADRVADDLFSQRLSIAQALQDLPLGNRAELRRWRTECAKLWVAMIGTDHADAHADSAA